MSSIRISQTGVMRRCMAHHDYPGRSDRSNHITDWSTQGMRPAPKKCFAGWTLDGEPMMTKPEKDSSTLPSDNTRSEPRAPIPKNSFPAWTEDRNPVMKSSMKDRSHLRNDSSRSGFERRSRIPPLTIRITTADGLEDDNGRPERDVSMRFFPSGKGSEVRVPDLHQHWAIDFAIEQQRSIPWGFASQRSGDTRAVKAFNEAKALHPWVEVIERPVDQEEGTVGCETWIRVEVPQAWSGVLP